MQDRVSLYPGRVTLTPVSGQANTYDMVRADQPTQEGTPLSKANLLSDTVAASYGEGTEAVPNDIFNILSRFYAGLGNEYLWKKIKAEITFGEQQAIILGTNYVSNRIEFGDSLVTQNGKISIKNPQYRETHSLGNGSNVLSGKYFRFPDGYSTYGTNIYYAQSGSTVNYTSGGNYWVENCSLCTATTEAGGYVNSSDPDAYPIDDGNEYIALGQLGGLIQIETGSYVGTGTTSGKVALSFTPEIVFVFGVANASNSIGLLTEHAAGYITPKNGSTWENVDSGSPIGKITTNGFVVGTWYDSWFNASGETNYYVAIGQGG